MTEEQAAMIISEIQALVDGLSSLSQAFTASWVDISSQVITQLGGLIQLLPLVLLSLLAFWKPNALLFLLVGGLSVMAGLNWYNIYTTPVGLTTALMLVAYGFIGFGYAIKCLVWKEIE